MDQVSQFETFLAHKPDGAQWDSSDSVFAFWIGINDVVGSAVSDVGVYVELMIGMLGKFLRLGEVPVEKSLRMVH